MIFNAFHIAIGQFGNVHQAVRAWKDFAEDTKIHDLSNSSLINFAHFRLLRDRMDPLDREFGSLRIAGRNEHTAVILNVHVRATFLDDLSDIFSSWPNQITNFLWIDSQLSDSRSIVRKFLARTRDRGQHFFKDLHSCGLCVLECRTENFNRHTGDLDVHLNGRNALLSARHFKIHISKVVFNARDVR